MNPLVISFLAYLAAEKDRLRGLQEERATFAEALRAIEANTKILADKAETSARDAKLAIEELDRLETLVTTSQKQPDLLQ